jgi:DNA-binding phage protein
MDFGKRNRRAAELCSISSHALDRMLELKDNEAFLAELSNAIRAAGGYTAAAVASRRNRTALYKILGVRGNPTLSSLVPLLAHIGLRLSVVPLPETPIAIAEATNSSPLPSGSVPKQPDVLTRG